LVQFHYRYFVLKKIKFIYVSYICYRRVLIDTGDADFPEYIENLQETMIKYDFQIDDIIVTHWHSDHIGGVTNVLDMIPNKNG